MAPLLALVQRAPAGSHARLDTAMFWVGAGMAFAPIVVGLGILTFLWWRRRKRANADPPRGASGPAGD